MRVKNNQPIFKLLVVEEFTSSSSSYPFVFSSNVWDHPVDHCSDKPMLVDLNQLVSLFPVSVSQAHKNSWDIISLGYRVSDWIKIIIGDGS